MLAPAVDPGAFHAGVDGSVVRERWGIGDDPLVVCVSRLVERKGQDVLIDSLGQWRSRIGGVRLMIVGDGPHREALMRRARERGVAKWVTFTGQVAEAELNLSYTTIRSPIAGLIGQRLVTPGNLVGKGEATLVPLDLADIEGIDRLGQPCPASASSRISSEMPLSSATAVRASIISAFMLVTPTRTRFVRSLCRCR